MLLPYRLLITSPEQHWGKPTSKWPSLPPSLLNSSTGWISHWRERQIRKLASLSRPNCTTFESGIWVQLTWDPLGRPGSAWDHLVTLSCCITTPFFESVIWSKHTNANQ